MTGAARRSGATSSPVALTALLAVMMIVSAMPLNLMGVLAALILPDLDISRSQLGLALSAVTAIGGVLSMFAGRITDAVGGRRTLRASFAIGASAMLAVAVSPSYAWLLAAAALTGVLQAFSNPSTNWVIAANFEPGRRGLATGVKQSGVQASLFLCGVGLPPIAEAAGWRVAVASLLVFPVAGLVATSVVPAHEGTGLLAAGRAARIRHPVTIRWLAAYSFSSGIGQSAIFSFTPLYANEEVGLSVSAAGLAGATIGFLGVMSRIVWTQRAERFSSMTTPLAVITAGSTIAGASLLAALVLGPPILWFGVVVAGLTMAASNAVVMLTTVMSARAGETGRASALVIVFFLAGNSIGPTAFGSLVDLTGGYRWAWTMVLAAFGTALTLLWAWSRSEGRARIG